MKRIDIMAISSLLIPFFVYLATLAPSVTFFDSGEFVTAIQSLGSPHSPGYPLFINYAKPFTYIPFGNIAFRVNIATAFSATAACYCVYLLITKMLEFEDLSNDLALSRFYKKTIALGSALTFAFSARLWLQSNHDKPYPLVSFLSALIFYLLLLWRESFRNGEERPAYIYLGAFICGLAIAAHQTIILLLPSFVFLIFSMDRGFIRRIKEIVLCSVFAIIGFSVHLHLPVRATAHPLLNWGDTQTLRQFMWHFLRRGYPVEKPHRDLVLFLKQLDAFNIPQEFTFIGLTLLLFGIFTFYRVRRDEIIAYLISIAVFLVTIVGYLNTPEDMIFLTEEFFTPVYMLTAVFIGLGVFSLLRGILSQEVVHRKGARLELAVAVVLIFSLPLTVCAINFRENDQHDNYIAYDYAANNLLPLPEESVLFTWGDSGAFPLWYLQGVERMREDISIVHTPHLYFRWYLDTFPELFRQNPRWNTDHSKEPLESLLKISVFDQMGNRPVYIDFSTRYSVQLPGTMLIQHGICYRLERGSAGALTAPDLSVWDRYTLRGVVDRSFFTDLDTTKAILIYGYSRMEGGETLLRLGLRSEGAKQLLLAEKTAPELKRQIEDFLAGIKAN